MPAWHAKPCWSAMVHFSAGRKMANLLREAPLRRPALSNSQMLQKFSHHQNRCLEYVSIYCMYVCIYIYTWYIIHIYIYVYIYIFIYIVYIYTHVYNHIMYIIIYVLFIHLYIYILQPQHCTPMYGMTKHLTIFQVTCGSEPFAPNYLAK